jgi:hypothetical protein
MRMNGLSERIIIRRRRNGITEWIDSGGNLLLLRKLSRRLIGRRKVWNYSPLGKLKEKPIIKGLRSCDNGRFG